MQGTTEDDFLKELEMTAHSEEKMREDRDGRMDSDLNRFIAGDSDLRLDIDGPLEERGTGGDGSGGQGAEDAVSTGGAANAERKEAAAGEMGNTREGGLQGVAGDAGEAGEGVRWVERAICMVRAHPVLQTENVLALIEAAVEKKQREGRWTADTHRCFQDLVVGTHRTCTSSSGIGEAKGGGGIRWRSSEGVGVGAGEGAGAGAGSDVTMGEAKGNDRDDGASDRGERPRGGIDQLISAELRRVAKDGFDVGDEAGEGGGEEKGEEAGAEHVLVTACMYGMYPGTFRMLDYAMDGDEKEAKSTTESQAVAATTAAAAKVAELRASVVSGRVAALRTRVAVRLWGGEEQSHASSVDPSIDAIFGQDCHGDDPLEPSAIAAAIKATIAAMVGTGRSHAFPSTVRG
jgi:hypothetical protein